MTTPAHHAPRTPELLALSRDVESARREGRFDEPFYQGALRRLAAAKGDFRDYMAITEAAVEVGLIPSVESQLNLKPTAVLRWDPSTKSLVRVDR